MVKKSDYIWMDGELVPWEKATVHVLTHTLHYGTAAFEGIRCYGQAGGGGAVFRLAEHIDRLLDSSKIVHMNVPFSREELVDACLNTVRANKLEECYVRPLVFLGDGPMGVYAPGSPVRVTVVVWKWGSYLGEEGLKNGIRAKISSYSRASVNASMARGKLSGQYIISTLAKREAVTNGYHEAILLDGNGLVAEASGENIFVVKRGKIVTPPLSSNILAGITRETIIMLLKEQGHEVVERPFTRDELYIADEVFMTGTAAEVTPVREIDDRVIGDGTPGPVTLGIQSRYFDVVRGGTEDYAAWRTRI